MRLKSKKTIPMLPDGGSSPMAISLSVQLQCDPWWSSANENPAILFLALLALFLWAFTGAEA